MKKSIIHGCPLTIDFRIPYKGKNFHNTDESVNLVEVTESDTCKLLY